MPTRISFAFSLQLFAKSLPAFLPFSINTQVQSQRNHGKLIGATDRKLFVDFPALLFADNNDAIGDQSRQQLFDRQEQRASLAGP